MDFFLLSSSQRLLEWRSFREKIKKLDEFDQLQEISIFWGKAPLVTFVLDWDKGSEWPSAWQLIYDGDFDTNAIAILMEQTLILCGWHPNRLKLMYIQDTSIEEQMMILVVDDKYALNYSHSEVYDLSAISKYSIFVKYHFKTDKHIEI